LFGRILRETMRVRFVLLDAMISSGFSSSSPPGWTLALPLPMVPGAAASQR